MILIELHVNDISIRGVRVRSESDPIGSDHNLCVRIG